MSERMSSMVTLQFQFHERKETDLEEINRLLAIMELTEVDVEDFDGYLARKKVYREGHEVGAYCWYGLDRITLVCRKVLDGQRYRYQMATEAWTDTDHRNSDELVRQWRQKYPDRRISLVIAIGFENHTAFVIVYCCTT